MTHHSRLGAALIMMTLVLSISTSALAVGSGGTGARSLTVDTDVFLGGDYIEIGISSTGSFGTKSAAPTSGGVFFHPNSTDVRNAPSANSLGLRANSSGWGAPDETKDFFLPGAIDEGFLIGWSSAPGSSATTRGVGSQISSSGNTNISGQSTVDMSTDTLLKAVSTGTVDSAVTYRQTISFAPSDKQFKTDVILTNTTASPIYNLTYVRRFDPDQNVLADNYLTDNYFLKDEAGVAWTIASTAKLSADSSSSLRAIDRQTALGNAQNVFCFYANDLRAESVYGSINFRDIPTSSYGNSVYGKHLWDDVAIGHITRLGTLAPGGSVTFSYYSSLDPQISSAISAAEDVTVLVTTQPVSRAFVEGGINGTLRTMGATLIDGKKYDELTYQWYSGGGMTAGAGTLIPGATSWDYVIPTALTANTYYYYCVVTDPHSGGSATSNVARINVVPAGTAIHSVSFASNLPGVSVTDTPVKQTLQSGEKLLDLGSPRASGYSFTGWYTDAACTNRWDFQNAVNAPFTLYAGWKSTTSFTVSDPASQTVKLGETALFNVFTTGTAAPVYQWQCDTGDGVWRDIPGATQNYYSLNAASMDYNGRHFRCRVTDRGATVFTNGALLTVTAELPPKTGDSTPIGLLLLTMGASGSCLIISGGKKRRRSGHA